MFFFFKQKTAYEMRISDWNSDVCSSDLVHHQYVEPLPSSGNRFGETGDALRLGQIERRDGGRTARRVDMRFGFLKPAGRPRGQDDMGASRRQCFGGCSTDPPASARHKGEPACQWLIHQITRRSEEHTSE